MFKKAIPVSSRLKATFYGGPGSGKSFTSLLLAEGLSNLRGRRTAYIDAEGGTKHYRAARPNATVHPEPFDFDVLDTKSLTVAIEAVRALNPEVHGVLIIDQLSWFNDAYKAAYKEKVGRDDIQIHEWARAKKPYKELVSLLIESPLDVIMLARESPNFVTNADGQMEYAGQRPKCDADTPYEGDLVMHLKAVQDRKDPTKTTYQAWVEKDRTSTLSGRVLVNSNFETFKPLIDLLGGDNEVTTSQEDALDRDVMAMAEREAEEEAKEQDREAVKRGFEAEILGVRTKKELEALGEQIKKSRKMRTRQKEALRAAYREAQERLVRAEVM